MKVDYLVVGSGITGATIARLLTDAGREVYVVERRPHVGGNVHDHMHPSGIRIHTYGPHYFRTNSERIWEFVNRFSRFYPYEAELKSLVDGSFENWPLSVHSIRRLVGDAWEPGFRGAPNNFEEASLAMMPRRIYEKFIKGYTEKQWGVPAQTLSASLVRRFEIRLDGDSRLMRHPYQGIPEMGYAHLMANMLAGIPVLLNVDFLKNRGTFQVRKLLFFTGPIDEFFNYRFGRLKYRGQRRFHEYDADCGFAQPCGQVNNPSPETGNHIRTLEWKHMMPNQFATRIRGTVLTKEVPFTPEDPDCFEYPFPDASNSALFQRYAQLAEAERQTMICGRLGEYRYYDMDQAIDAAMRQVAICQRL